MSLSFLSPNIGVMLAAIKCLARFAREGDTDVVFNSVRKSGTHFRPFMNPLGSVLEHYNERLFFLKLTMTVRGVLRLILSRAENRRDANARMNFCIGSLFLRFRREQVRCSLVWCGVIYTRYMTEEYTFIHTMFAVSYVLFAFTSFTPSLKGINIEIKLEMKIKMKTLCANHWIKSVVSNSNTSVFLHTVSIIYRPCIYIYTGCTT